MTEAQAIKAVETSQHGGLEQLALYLYSKTKAERDTFFDAEPTKQAAMLDLPVQVIPALMSSPAFLALTTRYSRARLYNPRVQAKLDEVMIDRMKDDAEITLPHIVRARQYLDEGIGISSSDGASRGGVSITINQQFNYGGNKDAAGQTKTLEVGEDDAEAYFTPPRAGGLPPAALQERSTATFTDKPLFLDREDRN